MRQIEIETAVVYETSIGFHNYATDFAVWADRALACGSRFFSPVPYYLYCRSLELVLKAYLLARGVRESELKKRKFGHNLVALMQKSEELHLADFLLVKPEWEQSLRLADDIYSTKGFEYFDVLFPHNALPDLPTLQDLTNHLLAATRRVCLEAADRPPTTS